MAKRGRPRKILINKYPTDDFKELSHPEFDDLSLSEESETLVKKGLQEAKEGKIEKVHLSEVLAEEHKTEITIEQKERKAKLNLVLKDINKSIPNAVNFANTIEEKGRLSFGYQCLDDLTGGGIVYGNTTTIWGSKGCGKSTLAYKLIATAQKADKIAAYLDVERSYDASWAQKFGVDTEALVYVTCKTAEEVLDTVIKLCKEKVVDLIVLDSIQGLSPHGEQYGGKGEKDKSVQDDTIALLARKLSQFFRMATSYIADAKCALLLIGQARMDLSSFIKMETLSGGHALMHNSRLILRLRRGQKADAPTEKIKNEEGKTESKQIGFDLCVRVDKSQLQGCVEGNEIHVPFLYTEGIT
jgi:RecA/RadA recombinase